MNHLIKIGDLIPARRVLYEDDFGFYKISLAAYGSKEIEIHVLPEAHSEFPELRVYYPDYPNQEDSFTLRFYEPEGIRIPLEIFPACYVEVVSLKPSGEKVLTSKHMPETTLVEYYKREVC